MARRSGPGLLRRTTRAILRRAFDVAGYGSWGSGGGGMLEASDLRRGYPANRTLGLNANGALLAGLDLARRRSVYATLNNAYLGHGTDAWVGALIGTGITTAASTSDLAQRKALQAAFSTWGESCDIEERLDWPGIQAAVTREMITAGECFVQISYSPDGMRLRVIPAEQCDWQLNRELPGGSFIYGGIEFNSDGVRTAYWIYPRKVGDFPAFGLNIAGQPVRVPASDMLHIFRPLIPGQIRGIPWSASILLTLAEMESLLDALVVSAKVANLHAGFIVDANNVNAAGPYEGRPTFGTLDATLEPGLLRVLPAGVDVKFSAPAQQNQGESTARLTLQTVAMGLGLPVHVLSGDVSNANYSSLRAAMVEWRIRIEQIQNTVIIHQLMRPIWQRWLTFASLIASPESSEVTSTSLGAKFYAPTQPFIDPLKDAEATSVLIAAGLMSRRQAVAEQGYDIEELDEEIAADHTREKALGLSFTTLNAAPSGVKENDSADPAAKTPAQPEQTS